MAQTRNIQDSATLQMALVGYQIEKQRIESRIEEIRAQLGGRRAPASAASAPRKRELSAAARKRIAEAQRCRWTAYRKRQAAQAKTQKPQSSKAQAAKSQAPKPQAARAGGGEA